jgi:hypothetical protein
MCIDHRHRRTYIKDRKYRVWGDVAVDPSYVAGVGAAGSVVALIFNFVQDSRRDRRIARLRQVTSQPVRALLCDYVDPATLRSLSAQYKILPRPEELEKTRGRKKGGEAEFSPGAAKLGINIEQNDEMKEIYRLPFDPNIVTAELIRSLKEEGLLRDDLMSLPSLRYKDLKAVVDAKPSLDNIEDIWKEMVVVGKSRQLRDVAENSKYILLEGQWRVEQSPDGTFELHLASMGDTQDEQVPLPESIVRAQLTVGTDPAAQMLTGMGASRLRATRFGNTVAAGVFGVGTYESQSSVLWIHPIAVFRRTG